MEDFTARKVVGLLTEGHLMRRCAGELDKARRDLSGEGQGRRVSRPAVRPLANVRRACGCGEAVGTQVSGGRSSGGLLARRPATIRAVTRFASFKQTRTVAKPVPSVDSASCTQGGVNGTMTAGSRAVISRGDRVRGGRMKPYPGGGDQDSMVALEGGDVQS